ncbi:cold shock domain-containing protein [Streptomyces sp. NPDC127084]|uniref:cold shock domain-containing protein n=1 Tax=Streptomyces sp. NPDC127084 TaxID=3347133 RepID=UPI00364AEFDA
MATGTVKWFNAEKGFGFIAQDGGPYVFLAHRQLGSSAYWRLHVGDWRVLYQPTNTVTVSVLKAGRVTW